MWSKFTASVTIFRKISTLWWMMVYILSAFSVGKIDDPIKQIFILLNGKTKTILKNYLFTLVTSKKFFRIGYLRLDPILISTNPTWICCHEWSELIRNWEESVCSCRTRCCGCCSTGSLSRWCNHWGASPTGWGTPWHRWRSSPFRWFRRYGWR